MQKKSMKNTTKLYIVMAVVIILVAALTLTLYFTLGARSNSGSENGTNQGTVEQLSAQVLSNGTPVTNLAPITLQGTQTNLTGSGIQIQNSSNLDAYVRAKVTFSFTDGTSTNGIYFEYDDNWTYAADNYLYYKYILSPNAKTDSLVEYLYYDSDSGFAGKQVQIRVIAEIIQREAAEPSVTITGDGISAVDTPSFSQGLMNSTYNMTALINESTDSRVVTITNTGKLDLNIKLRIASSEWTVSSATINSVSTEVERDANSGYYSIVGNLPAGDNQTCQITFIDANRNNDIVAPATTVSFIFQDYVVANDFYSIVDSNLQNFAQNENGDTVITINSTTKTQLANAKVYSYNNVEKYAYVSTLVSTGVVAQYGADWGVIEGEQTAVSNAISPKSTSSVLYDSTWINGLADGTTLTISVWSAIPVQTPTISLIQQNGLGDVSTSYQPVTATGATLTSTDLIINVSSAINASTITNAWGNLAVASTDYSDLLVRVSMALTWGTDASGSWVADATQPSMSGLDLSQYYGNGFSYNSEDASLTYSYNLANGQATSPILEFPSDISSLVDAINSASASSTGKEIKLTVMVEAIYAVGSQLDVIDRTGSSSIALDDFYLDIEGYTSMVQTESVITYTPNSGTLDWDKYSIYATNNFSLGVRVAVALQWGTLSGNTWTPSTTNSISEINLDDFIDKDYWTFDFDLGGYEYNCSIPGKSATKAIFDLEATNSQMQTLQQAINAEATSHSGEIVRLVIMVETTHKI